MTTEFDACKRSHHKTCDKGSGVDSESLTRALVKTLVGHQQQDVLHPFGWD